MSKHDLTSQAVDICYSQLRVCFQLKESGPGDNVIGITRASPESGRELTSWPVMDSTAVLLLVAVVAVLLCYPLVLPALPPSPPALFVWIPVLMLLLLLALAFTPAH
ncbi:hypothetical protein ZWY2020_026599 [Hordeum vulgare]|nr:hypothetical protein ZWY2020_026599 [Hordeum vulgare]